MSDVNLPPQVVIDGVLARALEEDLSSAGDITTAAVVPAGREVQGSIIARGQGVVAGLPAALGAFTLVDPTTQTDAAVQDGAHVTAGEVLASVSGHAHGMLAAERVCLNLLGHLSGIATATAEVVALIAHTRATIVDTRKTTPGLRALEKYAVRAGGGANHRFGLHDAVLIKDNHLEAAGGVTLAVKAARAAVGHMVTVEVEVENMEQLKAAIAAGADVVMLDNMSTQEMRAAVEVNAGRCLLEASGGITPATVVAAAESGVDMISMGWITHSAPRLDVALEFNPG